MVHGISSGCQSLNLDIQLGGWICKQITFKHHHRWSPFTQLISAGLVHVDRPEFQAASWRSVILEGVN